MEIWYKIKHWIFGKHNYRWKTYTEYCNGKKLYSYTFKECKICGYEPNIK
jgi:ribosomal protein L37E